MRWMSEHTDHLTKSEHCHPDASIEFGVRATPSQFQPLHHHAAATLFLITAAFSERGRHFFHSTLFSFVRIHFFFTDNENRLWGGFTRQPANL